MAVGKTAQMPTGTGLYDPIEREARTYPVLCSVWVSTKYPLHLEPLHTM